MISKKARIHTMFDPSHNVGLSAIVATRIMSVIEGTSHTIGTHDGSFHCDEALAVGMLKLLPAFASSTVVRTRKPEILAQCNIVVDVGGEYVPLTHRYDHHQRGFMTVLEPYKTKLSSAGLVYKHFGHDIIREVLKQEGPTFQCEDMIETLYCKVYSGFMEHIDAIDNGITVCDGTPKYNISTTLSSRVGNLNPAWNEAQSSEIMNERFKEAMILTTSEFLQRIQNLHRVWWPARSIVQQALDSRLAVHESGQIIVFEQACPWKDHLFELEAVVGCKPVIYALYEDLSGSWRVQAVPADPTSFDSRKKLPADWCGLRDQALSDKSEVAGSIFIHASGFIGGHNTKEGALALASKALDL